MPEGTHWTGISSGLALRAALAEREAASLGSEQFP